MSTPRPPVGPEDSLRAGNSDREDVVQRLHEAFAEGRLEVAELEQRVSAAYGAKTLGELRPLTADLPAGTARPSAPTPRPGRLPAAGRTSRLPLPVPPGLRAWLVAVLVNVVIWAAVSISSHSVVYFWPIWVAGPWGAILLAQALTQPRRRSSGERPDGGRPPGG